MALHVAVDYHTVEDVHRGEQRRRADKAGHPPLPTRLMAGLAILKSMHLVIVDTTVQPKAVAFPTDAKLMHRARSDWSGLRRARSRPPPRFIAQMAASSSLI
jgi:hypothetical protein